MLTITSKGFRELAASLKFAAANTGTPIQEVFEDMGPKIVNMLQRSLAPHKHTGELSDSVTWEYKSHARELHVGTGLPRKQFNALSLLERGTGPIPAVPFAPIARWAEFRGIPARPVWMSIKQKGVIAHPVREPLIISSELTSLLAAGAKQMGNKILLKALIPSGGKR